MELQVLDSKGKKVRSRKISPEIFDVDAPTGLLHQVVRWQRAKKRAGSHTVKTRAQARGGGRKPFRQKGTGNARAGSNTSPLWVGGGVAHGPKKRDYSFRINKNERRIALCGALSARRREEKLLVIEDFGLSEIKTKAAVDVLNAIGAKENKKVLVVLPEKDDVTTRSLRNVEGVKVLESTGLNVYDILNSNCLVVHDKAVDAIEARLAS